STPISTRSPLPGRTAWTFGGTSCGPCSTTSSGPRGTRSASVSSAWSSTPAGRASPRTPTRGCGTGSHGSGDERGGPTPEGGTAPPLASGVGAPPRPEEADDRPEHDGDRGDTEEDEGPRRPGL